MPNGTTILEQLGGEAGCKRLSERFYARVGRDPVLHPLFPGKTLKCAIAEFSAFLVQFLEGDEAHTQRRWWLSLRESHARFQIGPSERRAWLKHMSATLDATPLDQPAREALWQFFEHSSAYVMGKEAPQPPESELTVRWAKQRALDDIVAAIKTGDDDRAIDLASLFVSRPAVFVGILARMMRTGRTRLLAFVKDALERDASLITRRFAGSTLLHCAASAGCVAVLELLLQLGAEAGMPDAGGHTPLYRVANECAWKTGPEVVRILVRAGADPNACDGVMRATPLHMAARRGHVEIARALIDCGAATQARDRKGCTPLQRAFNCRKGDMVRLLGGGEHS